MVDPVEFKVLDLGIDMTPKPMILVVDDEQALQSVIYDTLCDDYRIVSAHNGREGVTRAINTKPQLILMDMMMPDMGGYEAVQMLRDNSDTRHIPIVMITAQRLDDSTIQLIKAEPNVVGFIAKPFRPASLRETVRVALNKQV